MREYKFKRGYEISEKRLGEELQKHFGSFEKEGDFYIVKNFYGIEELKAKIEGKLLLIETKTRLVDDETALKTLRVYNKFIESLTGYSAKERQKMLRKEVEV